MTTAGPHLLRTLAILVAVLGMVMLLAPDPAHSDQIDGHWCSKDGRLMSI